MNPIRCFLAWSLVSILAVSSSAAAQQPNSPTASAVWGGVNGPTWPVNVTASPLSPLTFVVSGVPYQPFLLAHSPAGLAAGAIPTPFGVVDLDLSLGLDFVVNGFGGTAPLDFFANTGASGTSSWTLDVTPSMVGPLGGFQTLVGDPTSPTGYRLSAATSITIVPAQVIYVSSTTGAPGNPGTMAAPVQTISQALALAAGPAWIRVASGTYAESPTFPNGLSVIGGLDPVTWVSSPTPSVVQVGPGGAQIAASASPTLQSLTFQAPNAPGNGASSITMRVLASAAPTFSACTFTAGNGAAGSPGPNGTAGPSGLDGDAGWTGTTSILSGQPGSGGSGPFAGGVGGPGGWATQDGWFGATGDGPYGGFGGSGGTAALAACMIGFPGMGGLSGGSGPNGTGGTHGGGGTINAAGSFVGGNGGNGSPGAHGSGGGGGGGGGGRFGGISLSACDTEHGGGGGGGGGGGSGGSPGLGGIGGGASFGVLVYAASPTFVLCTFNSGNGGAGGTGGNGASGAAGGAGGAGGSASNGGPGAPGGHGGAGASSGAGAGGSGGPSCGIAKTASAVVSTSGCTFNLASPGTGGAGGTAPTGFGNGQPGSNGLSGQVVQFN